jgi:hypothetical protein
MRAGRRTFLSAIRADPSCRRACRFSEKALTRSGISARLFDRRGRKRDPPGRKGAGIPGPLRFQTFPGEFGRRLRPNGRPGTIAIHPGGPAPVLRNSRSSGHGERGRGVFRIDDSLNETGGRETREQSRGEGPTGGLSGKKGTPRCVRSTGPEAHLHGIHQRSGARCPTAGPLVPLARRLH